MKQLKLFIQKILKYPRKLPKIWAIVIGALCILLIAGLFWYFHIYNSPQQRAHRAAEKKAKVIAWENANGATITSIVNDFNQLFSDAKSSNVNAVAEDCEHIKSDVETAQGESAIPDASTETEYRSALNQYDIGSTNCIDGLTRGESNLFTEGTSQLSAGDSSFIDATSQLQKLTD
jgi:hypothetical protein